MRLSAVIVLLLATPAMAQHAGHAVPPPVDASAAERGFLDETKTAMDRMMTDMAAPATGDVDRDFVLMMVPHHQGAIAMAEAVLRHGRNPKIRAVAQRIIADQKKEIVEMRRAVGLPADPRR